MKSKARAIKKNKYMVDCVEMSNNINVEIKFNFISGFMYLCERLTQYKTYRNYELNKS